MWGEEENASEVCEDDRYMMRNLTVHVNMNLWALV